MSALEVRFVAAAPDLFCVSCCLCFLGCCQVGAETAKQVFTEHIERLKSKQKDDDEDGSSKKKKRSSK